MFQKRLFLTRYLWFQSRPGCTAQRITAVSALPSCLTLGAVAARVVRSLNQVIQWRGKPAMIRVDNGRPNMGIGGVTPAMKLNQYKMAA